MACSDRTNLSRAWTDHASATDRVLAAFESGFHVEFIDFDRPFKLWSRRVQRFLRTLDAPVDHFVGDSISTSSCLRLVLKRI